MPHSTNHSAEKSLAWAKIEEKAEQDRLEKINTKQKAGTPLRDIGLQHKVLYWMMELLGEKPKGKTDFDHWIQDPTVLARVLHACMYNSVPMDMIEGPVAKVEKKEDQLDLFIKYAARFGVPEEFLFDPEKDLLQMRNIPKVTRCLAVLGKLANMKEFEGLNVEELKRDQSQEEMAPPSEA